MWHPTRSDAGPRMRRSRLLSASVFIGAALAATLTLSACSSAAPNAGGDGGDGGASDDSLQKVIDQGVLHAGACLTSPPWGSIAANGDPEGFDVDVLTRLADFIGVPVDIVEVTGAARVPSLQSGQVDVSACTFSITDERKEQVDFSNPVIATGISLAVAKGSPIKSIDDTDGRSIALVKGSNYIPVVQKVAPGAQIQQYDTVADCFLAVQQGQADAVAEQSLSVSILAADNPDIVVVEDGTVGDERIFQALGVAKGKSALLEKYNEFLAEFHGSGADKEVFAKWFPVEPGESFNDLPETENLP